MLSRLTLAGNELGNVALIFDLRSALVAAGMLGNYLKASRMRTRSGVARIVTMRCAYVCGTL
jgi:hypothetical protein